MLRRAWPNESDALAAIFRLCRDTALPYLPDIHTPDDDSKFFRDQVFPTCDVWVAQEGGALTGFCALRQGWIDHLYVHPAHQRAGIGTALLRKAMEENETLQLWTFQRNAGARAFYVANDFSCVRTTNGEDNEEREPDALYAWSRSSNSRISFVSSKPSRS